jgi:F-type H+-transporting ATPase subunit epsilon
MADMMQFELVSPERMLASLQVIEVEIPGAEGDFTAMADHAALVTTMRTGILKAKSATETTEYVVTGGFVEVSGTTTSVLAENAVPRSEMTRDAANAILAEAEAALAGLTGAGRDAADKRLADTKALVEALGL